jgi:hypothetical protein
MLQGVQTVLPPDSVVSTASGTLTQALMVTQLQSIMQDFTDVDDYRIAFRQAIQKVDSSDVSYRDTYARLKGAIVAYFGARSPQLQKFGLSPKTVRPLTTLQKAARDARSAETRKLRGTLGEKAKQALQYTGAITVTAQPAAAAAEPPQEAPEPPAEPKAPKSS